MNHWHEDGIARLIGQLAGGRRDDICCVISADRNAHGRDCVLSAAHPRPAHIPPCANTRGVAALMTAAVVPPAVAVPTVHGARIPLVGADAPPADGAVGMTGKMMAMTMSRRQHVPTGVIAVPPTTMMRWILNAPWFRRATR